MTIAAVPSDPTENTLVGITMGGTALVAKAGGVVNIETGAALQFGGVDTTAALANLGNNPAKYQNGGASITLTAANTNQTTKFNTTGTTATLPAATGSGAKFRFLTTVIPSGSNVIKVANSQDFMIGGVLSVLAAGGAASGFVAANSGTVSTNSDTITLSHTTSGSAAVGEWVEVEDVAANTWAVSGMVFTTATPVTPFSAGV